MPNRSTAAPFPSATCAEVLAHDRVMRYRRFGAGPAVLLLGEPEADGALWPELHRVLAARFRLIVPELPDARTDVTAWLGDFLEGLGTSGVAIVAADPFCVPALELALLD